MKAAKVEKQVSVYALLNKLDTYCVSSVQNSKPKVKSQYIGSKKVCSKLGTDKCGCECDMILFTSLHFITANSLP